jgi:hypothetical protein
MAGMKFKSFPLMGTWLFASAFILATFGDSVVREGSSFLISGILSLAVVIYALIALVTALFDRTKVAWGRCLIIAIAICTGILALKLGAALRDQIFLWELPKYQKITDLLIREQTTAANTDVCFPSGYTSELVNDKRVSIEQGKDKAITVIYFTRDSSALGHAGYLYRSDDNLESLHKLHLRMGIGRLAPKWYVWGD